jgi:putative spermidine/putrescine transport system ATP-binding protein/spermidine/putrescine transport system ATP-binding protein
VPVGPGAAAWRRRGRPLAVAAGRSADVSRVQLKRVVKKFGEFTALHELDLDVREGEFLTLLGPSGCGKTTTLRLVAGFVQPTTGTILLGDEDVTRVAPQHRQIGMVFQDYALFPHMTVADNIAFGLKERRYSRAAMDARVEELLRLIRLPDVGGRYPAEVSGGQQQRIAVARAVAHPPRVLLMDEPLGALDLKLRETMQMELRRIQQELGITTIYVTHDQTEAMNMSDRIVVMNGGRIEQVGGAEDIYNHPRTRFVAEFVGQINLLDAAIVGEEGQWGLAETMATRIRVPRSSPAGTVSVAIRPEMLRLLSADEPVDGMNVLAGRIASRSFAGNLVRTFVDVGGDRQIIVESRPNESSALSGASVQVAWSPSDSIILTE